MPTPDTPALAALREAEETALFACESNDLDDLYRYRDAVAARVREEGKEREVKLMALAMEGATAPGPVDAIVGRCQSAPLVRDRWLHAARALRDAWDRKGET